MSRIDRTRRVLVALAALQLRRDEIDDFLKFTAGLTSRELYRVLSQIEHDMLLLGVGDNRTQRKETLFRSSTANDVVNRVLILLRSEANLGSSDIIDGLTELLRKENESGLLPRFIAKKSLAEWLSAVTKVVGPSKLLQVATVLRNQRVHEERSPWPLDKPK